VTDDPGTVVGPFDAEIWLWKGPAAWHFVTVPEELADTIRVAGFLAPRGWGMVRVKASCGDISWETSVFPDRNSGSYLLPIKAEVRWKLGVGAGDRLRLALRLVDQPTI
jgi:hypothetical protein